jgi:LAO/AO transport system kinase
LIDFYRKQGKRVGVIAVDPTSPFTGGAILGDRIRMQAHALDKGVFIRSMGTRGSLGGLSRATREAVTVLDAMGREVILVETVGVGQSEVDIVKTADTTLVVLTPAGGDSVQTLKAGIMEIADIFVVNKADLDGADRTIREVQMMLDLNNSPAAWRPPVIPTKTLLNEGLSDLLKEIEGHRQHLSEGGRLEASRKEKARLEVLELVEYKIKSKIWKQVRERNLFEDMLQRILTKTLDPYTAADQLLREIEI